MGLDLAMLLGELQKEKGYTPRGLAHPVIFRGGGGGANATTFIENGAVEVSPRALYKLLQARQVRERSERPNKDARARLRPKPVPQASFVVKLTISRSFTRFARILLSWHLALRARCSNTT